MGNFAIKGILRLRLSPEFAHICRLKMAGTIGNMSLILFPTALAVFTAVAMMTSLPCVSAENCGQKAGGAVCPGGLCCSQFGFCGSTQDYCGQGCQSQCAGGSSPTPTTSTPTPSGQGVASIITEDLFNKMLKHKDDSQCKAKGFYTYAAFIDAASAFPGFGTTGDLATKQRELAAFLAQTSHETTGGSGWADAPNGPYAWGYCFKEEQANPSLDDYCNATISEWRCASGKKYYGRGPIQISWNYNYGPAGKAIGFDGINNPDIVASDSTISFKTAVWFWMTAQSPKPSCHDVMTGSSDSLAGRPAGYGLVTNIINGGLECGPNGIVAKQEDRIGFYKRYCDILGVSYGSNLDCNSQTPFAG